MMRDVVTRGTARRAGEALGRTDLAGKTGTTNNQLDAWFAGYNNTVVASAWVGSDGLDPLGRGESGGIAALPIWTTFMAETVVGTPEAGLETLPGMTAVRIDRRTGEPSAGDGTIIEYFFDETVPEGVDLVRRTGGQTGSGTGQARAVTAAPRTSIREQQREVDQLF